MRFPLRLLLNAAVAGGVILALWPLGQSAFGLWNQRSLAAQFAATKSVPRAQVPRPAPARLVAAAPRAKPAPWHLTKLSIPAINLETFIVQGMDAPALRRGPGHDVNSSPPGAGNCVIAGHRNVYGSFFYRVDELEAGASITLENRYGKWNYSVDRVYATTDTDLTILKPPPPGEAPLLTLITCTLPHTSNRIIVQAHLIQE